VNLQKVIDNHSKVFGEIPKGITPAHYHDHSIQLQVGSVPHNNSSYRYPYTQNSEIEHMIQEMLEVGILNQAIVIYIHY